MSLCLIWFFLLMTMPLLSFMTSMICMMNGSAYFIEWDLVSLSSYSIVMTLLIDWMSLLFMSFVMWISSLVILYSQNYMLSDISLNCFNFLVLMFVLSMIF